MEYSVSKRCGICSIPTGTLSTYVSGSLGPGRLYSCPLCNVILFSGHRRQCLCFQAYNKDAAQSKCYISTSSASGSYLSKPLPPHPKVKLVSSQSSKQYSHGHFVATYATSAFGRGPSERHRDRESQLRRSSWNHSIPDRGPQTVVTASQLC